MSITEQGGNRTVEQAHLITSSELITVLRTLPKDFCPEYFEIMLHTKAGEETIPSSRVKFEWRNMSGQGMFSLPYYQPIEFYHSREDPESIHAIRQALMAGKKPTEVVYKSERAGFEMFVGDELEEQVINGPYQLDHGELCVTLFHRTGYSEGDYADTTIYFRREKSGGYSLDLRIGNTSGKLSPENIADLENWYASLPFVRPTEQAGDI